MAKGEADLEKSSGDEKLDGLEITSIGSLYTGPWDKKYWSCSRGKDRYPYPVGYQAVRVHSGSAYKMEIHEGSKGPLFEISSPDGDTVSGQTPDMAWDKFQRKGFPRVKIWHAKRFSCKIDGVEFFGLKNPLVQRLLRELVANVSGTTELNSLSSNFDNGPSGTGLDDRWADTCTYPDLLPLVARTPATGKRSRKLKGENVMPVNKANSKKPRTEDLIISKLSNSVLVDALDEKNLLSAAKEETTTDVEKEGFAGSECRKRTRVADNLSADENPLDRSNNNKVEVPSLTMKTEADNGGNLVQENTLEESHLCAPDMVDFIQVISDSAPIIKDNTNLRQKNELAALSEIVVLDSLPEENMGTVKSSYDSSDFDSVGQEMVVSMMEILLPESVPLLKNRKKKKVPGAPSENFIRGVNSQAENDGSECYATLQKTATNSSPITKSRDTDRGKDINNQNADISSSVPSFELFKSVIPDSLEEDQCPDHPCNKVILSSHITEVGQATSNDAAGPINSLSEETKHHNTNSEAHTFQINSKEKDFEIAPDCSTNNDLVTTCSTRSSVQLSNGNSACNIRGKLSSVEPQRGEIVSQRGVAKTDKPVSQVPRVVYTRKKPRGASHLTTKLKIPVAEDTMSNLPKKSPSTRSMHTLEINQTITLPENQQNKDLIHTEATLGEAHGKCSVDTSVKTDFGLNSVHPALHKDQDVVCAIDKDTSGILDPSILHMEKFEASGDRKVVRQADMLETHSYESTKENLTNICVNYKSDAKENGALRDLRLPSNVELYHELEGMVQLVGCYFHPVPVLSLFLGRKENAIYICVLCGLPVDKNRTLFTYKVETEEPKIGYPSCLGHTSVTMPVLKDNFGKEIILERSGFQLTPEGELLVLLDSIRTPYCRAGKVNCSCSTCSWDYEENVVKIVQVEHGYVSVVTKLKAANPLHCILVCKPNHLIAVGESGRLHLWILNSTWSTQTGNYIIPSYDCASPGIVEVKKVPNFPDLIVGHNGFDEFSLWDISRRSFMSRFSYSNTSVHQFFPTSSFCLQRKGLFNNSNIDEHVNEMIAAMDKMTSDKTEKSCLQLKGGENITICLFVSTTSVSDVLINHKSEKDYQTNPEGSWKLALLANNTVIFGTTFESRASAMGALAGKGIIGTRDGLVYMWELSTGTKLGTLLRFKGSSVSNFAMDDDDFGALAVVSDGKLLVYLKS